MSADTFCPHCGSDQQQGRRTIGAEIRGVFDGVLYWMCPDCGGAWHRFPSSDRLWSRARPYVEAKTLIVPALSGPDPGSSAESSPTFPG